MTDEQFTTGPIVEIINLYYYYYYLTAKDIRRRGKNKVGVNPFKISAMNNIFLSLYCSYLIYSVCRMLHRTAENEQIKDVHILKKVT